MFDKEEIKRRINLSTFGELLGKLEKLGSEHKAICPLHQDTNPSLSIAFKEGAWKWYCHPCRQGGDIFKLVELMDKTIFRDALARVAGLVGVEEDWNTNASGDWFSVPQSVVDLGGQPEARAYLASRGICPDIAQQAQVGFAEYPGLGPAISMPYSSGTDVVKFRALGEGVKGNKFRHLAGGNPSNQLLYGIEQVSDVSFAFETIIVVAESELDSLMVRSHGIPCVSVSSATACVNKEGGLQILSEQIAELQKAEFIFLALDQDKAGNECADAFVRALRKYNVHRVTWPYVKGESGAKDLGELYEQNPADFRERLLSLCEAAKLSAPYLKAFRSPDQLSSEPIDFLVEGLIPEGVTMLGARAGTGKTWFALSLAKSLLRAEPFLDHFRVPKKRNILYLIPEAGERSFSQRLRLMGIREKNFLVRTVEDGPMQLTDELLLAAVRDLKPVVFLDTFGQFNTSESENDASQMNQGIVSAINSLRTAGAIGIIALHHSPKGRQKESPNLDNTLRGSTAIAGNCDTAYALVMEEKDRDWFKVTVTNIKPRDFDPPSPFVIQGRPFINDTGNFKMIEGPSKTEAARKHEDDVRRVGEHIAANPTDSVVEIASALAIDKNRITTIAKKAGWSRPNKSRPWVCEGTALEAFDSESAVVN